MKKEIAKVVSKEYSYWTKIKEKTELEIQQLEDMLKFNKAINLMCLEKIKKEKRGVRKIFG